jgi:hypothetical protein
LDKTGITLPPEAKKLDLAIKKLSLIDKHKEKVSKDEFSRLLSLVDFPEEIKLNVEKAVNKIVCSVFACLVGMQADNHHLKAFGTIPELPYILGELPPIPFMYESISSFYSAIINAARIEGIISQGDAINTELALCESIIKLSPQNPCIGEIIDNVRLLNSATQGDIHRNTVDRLRLLAEPTKKLLHYDR